MAKAKALLLTNGGHARLPNNLALLADIFARQAQLNIQISDDHSEMSRERLRDYDLILDYSGYSEKEPTDDQLNAVMEAVEAGTPYIGLHVASLPFRSQLEYKKEAGGVWPANPAPSLLLNETQLRYFTMVGSVFLTHSPIKKFTLHLLDSNHPITQGVTDFEIEDEIYDVAADWTKRQVLAEAEGYPLLYTHQWGKGKVHYNALGHDQRAFANPANQRLLIQAVAWALAEA